MLLNLQQHSCLSWLGSRRLEILCLLGSFWNLILAMKFLPRLHKQ